MTNRDRIPRNSGLAADVLTIGDRNARTLQQRAIAFMSQFWVLPALVLIGFVLLGLLLLALDQSTHPWVQAVRQYIGSRIFTDWRVAEGFLRSVGNGFMTLMSLTFSLLAVMLQQAANNLGNLIYDQFLKRRGNQLYAGYLIGTAVMAYLLQTATSPRFIPYIGSAVVFLTLFFSVLFLIFFTYSMIDRMSPETIIRVLRNDTLASRERQLRFLRRTRRQAQLHEGEAVTVRSALQGNLVSIDLDRVSACLASVDVPVEIVMRISLGTHVAYLDPIADVRSPQREAAQRVAECLGVALHFGTGRQWDMDAGYGIELLETLAFTAASAAKQSTDTSQRVAHVFRDLLVRWTTIEPWETGSAEEALPLVYADSVLNETVDAMQSVMVASAEAGQHMSMGTTLIGLAAVFPSLPPGLQDRAQEVVMRTLPELNSVPFTIAIDESLSTLATVFQSQGRSDAAAAVRRTRSELAGTLPLQVDAPPARDVGRGSSQAGEVANQAT